MNISRDIIMRQAIAEAGKWLRKLDIDCNSIIDIFGIIKKLGIELMFRPLEGKPDGYYFPSIDSTRKPGILINSRRLYSRQRYTAAHELCHFIKKDPAEIVVINDGCQYIPPGKSSAEVFADFFAGHFLMPAKLVTYLFRKLGLKKNNLSESDIYRLSLLMRTSYQSTCNHLRNLEFISSNQYSKYIKISPKTIKETWKKGIGHNDIWPITKEMNGLSLLPIVDDFIHISLPETPSTGYIWEYRNSSADMLQLEKKDLAFKKQRQQIGQEGTRIYKFRVNEIGDTKMVMHCKRPWENENNCMEEFVLHVISAEKEFIGHFEKDDFLLAA